MGIEVLACRKALQLTKLLVPAAGRRLLKKAGKHTKSIG